MFVVHRMKLLAGNVYALEPRPYVHNSTSAGRCSMLLTRPDHPLTDRRHLIGIMCLLTTPHLLSLALAQWCSCAALLLYPTSLKRPMISPIEKKPMVSAVTMPTCVKAPESRFLSRSRNDCGLLIAWSAVFSAALAVRDPRLAGLDTAFRSGAMADWTVCALLEEKLVFLSE